MRTRKPIQAKSTESIIKAILPQEFKMVKDKTSNGYKFINLLYGVEIDQAKEYLQSVYDNSFLESVDLADDGILYEVYLSGIPSSGFLNAGGTKVKITNWDSLSNSEFYDGPPTRLTLSNQISISGIVQSGNIVGLNYFRSNASGYGYYLINADIDSSEFLSLSGSSWKIYLDNNGNIQESSGFWPAVGTFNYSEQGRDDVLYPLTSGYLSKTYPLTRRIRDDSGVYWNIDHYEPYLGWTRDNYSNVVAINNYSGDYYYSQDGKKIWYRTAFNNPYGSGNYTTEYLNLRNIPISGTLKLYDIDIIDVSGNAVEIPSSGKILYKLQSSNMLRGSATGVFDPVYVGYDPYVPEGRGFGDIEGLAANYYLTTSWLYQQDGSFLDEGSMQYVEGSGSLSNVVKINNPVSRYIAEYKFKQYNKAKYITSLDSTRYVNFDTDSPVYSIESIFNNQEELQFEFTRDPSYNTERSRFITFDGWKIRPNSKISKIDFKIPVMISTGPLDSFLSVAGLKSKAGYGEFVPDIVTTRNYSLNCIFDQEVYLGGVTEDDKSGSGNYLIWTNTGSNEIYRYPIDTNYGKRIKYVDASGYYRINSQEFLKDNTFFRFRFRAYTPQVLTLMELESATNKYIKVQVTAAGMISIISNGVEQYYSFDKLAFGNSFHDLIIRYYPDPNWTDNPVFDLYIKGSLGYYKPRVFTRETTSGTFSSTYLHVYQNCSIDADLFQIYYETNYGDTI